MTSEGVFGSQFDKDLRDKKELNKHLSEVLPEISVNKRYQSITGTYKRKSSYMAPKPSAKKTRTDHSETYNKSRPWSSQYKIPPTNYYKGDNFFRGDNKSKNVVSSFQRNFQSTQSVYPQIPVGSRLQYFIKEWEKNRRQMGSFDNSRRAKIRVHFKTKLDRNKRNLCTCQKYTYYSNRGRKFIRKGCHRICPNF